MPDKTKPTSRTQSFVSHDYLGLSQHIQVKREAIRAIQQFGTSLCTAPNAGRCSALQQQLEASLTSFFATDDSLLLPIGCAATLAVLSALVEPGDSVFVDEYVQPNVLAAAPKGICHRLPHNAPEALEAALQASSSAGGHRWVVVYGVYPHNGDLGKIKAYLDIAERHGAWLIVDDTDGIGIFGKKGAGRVEEEDALGRVALVTGGLSKALGTLGGFASGRKELIARLRRSVELCSVSTTLPPPCMAAALQSLVLIERYDSERKELLAKADYARTKLRVAGFDITPSASPIMGIVTPNCETAELWATRLLERNIYIATQPAEGHRPAQLRFILTHLHTHRDIDLFVGRLLEVSQPNYPNMAKQRRSSAEISQLIDQATESIVREKGFSGLSIQEVCTRATIEPAMFYRRYPKGFAFYVEQFIREHDFWFDFYNSHPIDNLLGTPEELTYILTALWNRLESDGLLQASLRVELQDSPSEASVEMAKERDALTKPLVELFSASSPQSEQRKVQLAILTAGIQYLALHKKVSPFCGIDFSTLSEETLKEALAEITSMLLRS